MKSALKPFRSCDWPRPICNTSGPPCKRLESTRITVIEIIRNTSLKTDYLRPYPEFTRAGRRGWHPTMWIWGRSVPSRQYEARLGPVKMELIVAHQAQDLINYWMAQVHARGHWSAILYLYFLTSHSGVGRRAFANHSQVNRKALMALLCDLVNVSRVTCDQNWDVPDNIWAPRMNNDQLARSFRPKEDAAAKWSITNEIEKVPWPLLTVKTVVNFVDLCGKYLSHCEHSWVTYDPPWVIKEKLMILSTDSGVTAVLANFLLVSRSQLAQWFGVNLASHCVYSWIVLVYIYIYISVWMYVYIIDYFHRIENILPDIKMKHLFPKAAEW